MSEDLFLTDRELRELTGRAIRKLQIAALRDMLVPFRVNAIGRPVVTRAAVLGAKEAQAANDNAGWVPRVLRG